jgi:hypothetical protein
MAQPQVNPAILARMRAAMPRALGGSREWGLRGVAMAVGLVPVIGAGIAYFFDRKANSVKAENRKEALAKWYAPQLGIDPARASAKHLEAAAKYNGTMKQIVDGVNTQETSDNVKSLAAAGGGTVASMLIPGGSTLLQGAVRMAGTTGASIGSAAMGGWLTSPDTLKDPQAIAEILLQARMQGHEFQPVETFMLKVAKEKPLQDAIKKMTGTEYYSLSTEQQAAVMGQFPRVAEYAARDAAYLNNGGDVRSLVTTPAGGSSWMNKVAAEQAARGGVGPTI